MRGVYTTEAVTGAVQEWIEAQMTARPQAKTFAYVAHEAVHGPMEVPERYLNDECRRLIPDSHPTRRIYCGMVRAVDESVKNITETYKRLGIWTRRSSCSARTMAAFRRTAASTFRCAATRPRHSRAAFAHWASSPAPGCRTRCAAPEPRPAPRCGLAPTLVGGAAGLEVPDSGRACPRATGPWRRSMASTTGSISRRARPALARRCCWTCSRRRATSTAGLRGPGHGALRVGRWKPCTGTPAYGRRCRCGGAWCTARTGVAGAGNPIPIPIPANASNPWCPYGWTPAPGSGLLPRPAPEVAANCTVTETNSCAMPADAHYIVGGTMLFDVEADMFEEHDVAAQHPDVVATLLARLQEFNNTHCGCALPPTTPAVPRASRSDPSSAAAGPVWLPWRGSSDPGTCDTNRSSMVPTPPPTPPRPPHPPMPGGLHASTGAVQLNGGAPGAAAAVVSGSGWCWDDTWAGGGVPPMVVRVSVDGAAVATLVANHTRAKIEQTGAPNKEHGWVLELTGAAATKLAGSGSHKLDLDVFLDAEPTSHPAVALPSSPFCFSNGKPRRLAIDDQHQEIQRDSHSTSASTDTCGAPHSQRH